MRPLAGAAAPPTRAYSGYVLLCLLLGYTFNFLDRVVVGVLQEPLRNEFSLSDFQLGLLGGPAFAILYTVTGIPIARWADRGNRVFIVSLAIGLWSTMTAVTGPWRQATFTCCWPGSASASGRPAVLHRRNR